MKKVKKRSKGANKLRGSFSNLHDHLGLTVLNYNKYILDFFFFFFYIIIFGMVPPSNPCFPSPPSPSLFPGFYRAKADVVIYCGHPSLVLIHHRPVARRSWQQLFAFEFNRGAVSQRRQVKSITNAPLSRRIINQRQER